MDCISEVIEYVSSLKGVHQVFEMDDRLSNEIWEIEKNVRTRITDDYKNIGYDMAMEREHRICIIYDDDLEFGQVSTVKLIAGDGTVMGTTLRKDEIESYKGRDDVIWISDDFVVFPYIIGKGEESFVLYPFEIPEISDHVGCVRDLIGTSPTPSSDAVLKSYKDVPMTERLFTSVIAFNDSGI